MRSTFAAGVAIVAGLACAPSAQAAPETVAAARAAVADVAPEVLAAPLDSALGTPVRQVLGYPLDNVAQVITQEGKAAYVVSSERLAVDGKSISLELGRSSSGFVTSSAPVQVQLSGGGSKMQIDSPSAPPIVVERVGTTPADETGVTDGRVVFAGIAPDHDALVEATQLGAETYETLRSPEAEHVLRWRVGGGLTLSRSGATVVVTDPAQPDVTLLTIAAPWARDANGVDVPLELSIEGDGVVRLDVRPPENATYPVLVDPTWSSSYDWQHGSGAAGWFKINSPVPGRPQLGYDVYNQDGPGLAFGAGIWIWPQGSSQQNEDYVNTGGDDTEVRGAAFFKAPGTTRISRAWFEKTTWELRQENCSTHAYDDVDQYLRFTLRDENAKTTRDDTQIGPGVKFRELDGVAVPLVDPTTTSTNASVSMWTLARTASLPKHIEKNPRTAAGCNRPVTPFFNVGLVVLELVDNDAPVYDEVSGEIVDWATDPDHAWIGPDTASAATGKVRVHDAGAGLDTASAPPAITAVGPAGGQVVYVSGGDACDPSHRQPGNDGHICPERVDTTYTADNPFDLGRLVGSEVPPSERDGVWDLSGAATDLVGHRTTHRGDTSDWLYYVDTTAPTVEDVAITGDDGHDLRGRWIRATQADASGNVNVQPQTTDPVVRQTASGVKFVGLEWQAPAQAPFTLIDPATPQCGPGSPRPYLSITRPCPELFAPDVTRVGRHLAEGRHAFAAKATDHVGNETATPTTREVWVDNTAPVVETSGSLADADGAWLSGSEPLDLAVSAADKGPAADQASGVRSATVTVTDGGGRAIEPDAPVVSCTAAQPQDGTVGTAPAPVCPLTGSGSVTVDPGSWPEGRIEVATKAQDVVGNERPSSSPDVVLHVDRTPPTVVLGGELATFGSDEWVNPGNAITASVAGTDDLSGILALELWVRDESGERRLDRATVCEPPAETERDVAPCPLTAHADFEVDPAIVGDGRATFEARAVEFTGRVREVRHAVLLDETPPPAPENARIERVLGSAVAKFDRPEVVAGTAPIVGYQYGVLEAGETEVTYTTTEYSAVPLPSLPPGLDADVYLRTLDATGAVSPPKILPFGTKPRGVNYGCSSSVKIVPHRGDVYRNKNGDLRTTGVSAFDVKASFGCLATPTGVYSIPLFFEYDILTVDQKTASGKLGARSPKSNASDQSSDENGVPYNYRTAIRRVDGKLTKGTFVFPQLRVRCLPGGRFGGKPGWLHAAHIGGIRLAEVGSAISAFTGLEVETGTVLIKPKTVADPFLTPCDADGLWRFDAWDDSKTGAKDIPKDSDRLRASLLDDPKLPAGRERAFRQGSFEAHHIIPTFDTRTAAARKAQELGYACGIEPNDRRNGVFLSKDFHKYRHNATEYGRVVDALRGAITGNDLMKCDRGLAWQKLSDVGDALIARDKDRQTQLETLDPE